MSVHYARRTDSAGDVVDLVPFCGDFCHRNWCDYKGDVEYEGWDGCHETFEDYGCANCGKSIPADITEEEI